MVVKSTNELPDLGYLALFLGLRLNELVMDEMKRAGFPRVRESHGYVIQHVIESERSITALARRMEVTQQAASKVVRELIGLGILESMPARDRRATRIRLSERGWRSVRIARRARSRLKKRLMNAIGEGDYEHARSTLLVCLQTLGGISRVRSRRVRPPA